MSRSKSITMNVNAKSTPGQSKVSIFRRSPSRVTFANPKLSSIMSLLSNYRGSVAFRINRSGYKVPRYQNTYQLNPNKPFCPNIVDKILKDVMTAYLINITKYHPALCRKICQDMAAETKKQIFKTNFDRYKYAVSMIIIEKFQQGIDIAMGFVWDPQKDSYCQYVFENSQFYAIGIVSGVYYE